MRQGGDLEGTRKSRARFRNLLLPTTNDYINEIDDELEILTNNANKQHIKNLFDSALRDHPVSIDLWLKYLNFCELNPEIISGDLVSEYKKAAAFAAWDLKRGHLLCNGNNINNKAIPYISHEDSSKSPFESFEADFPTNLTQYIEAVKASKFLNSSDKLTLCRVLFERAIETDSTFNYWETYLKFLRAEMGVSTIILNVNNRLIRVHPLNSSSWILLLENLELFNKLDEVQRVWKELLPKILLNSSHETFLSLQMAYLDCLRRKEGGNEVVLAFQMAIQEEELLFGRSGNEAVDPQGRLPRYFSRILLSQGEIERFRSVWQQILKQHAKEAAFWLEYLQLERTLMNRNELETITNGFKRAAASVTDYPETIFYEWIQFERQYGKSLQSLLDAQERIGKQRAILKEREQQRKQKEKSSNKRTRVESIKEPEPAAVTVESKVKSFNPDATLFVNNLPFNFTESDIATHFNYLISKLGNDGAKVKSIRMHMNSSGNAFKGHATIEFDSPETCAAILEKFNRHPADESGRPVFLAKYVSPLEKHQKTPSIDKSESDAKTLYISNLPFRETVRVEELFKGRLPGIQQIRHVYGKQFAYIEFENESMAAEALKLIPEIDESIKAAFSKPPAPKIAPKMSTTLLKPRSVSVNKKPRE